MTRTSDITIIGGGIIGLLTAREFYNAGASVTLIEKNLTGQESSWAGGGILLPLYPWRQSDAISHLVIQSLKLYPNLALQLKSDTSLDPEWNPCGLLITKNPDIATALDWCNKHNILFENANMDFFNGINTIPDNPLWLPEIAQARNPRLLKSLKQDIINKNIKLIENCELTAVKLDNNEITSIKTSSGQFTVNQLVISTGAWTGQIFEKFFSSSSINLPKIAPVKGQMILFDARQEILNTMVLDGDQYLIPRLNGKILAGSTVELDDFNKRTTIQTHTQLKNFALDLLPALKNRPVINHWAGLRPGTENGIPYIDIHPDIQNLSINAGHFRNGLAMGPASAQLLVDLVLKRPTAIAAEPYQLSSCH